MRFNLVAALLLALVGQTCGAMLRFKFRFNDLLLERTGLSMDSAFLLYGVLKVAAELLL